MERRLERERANLGAPLCYSSLGELRLILYACVYRTIQVRRWFALRRRTSLRGAVVGNNRGTALENKLFDR
jgi:hypothetical protein